MKCRTCGGYIGESCYCRDELPVPPAPQEPRQWWVIDAEVTKPLWINHELGNSHSLILAVNRYDCFSDDEAYSGLTPIHVIEKSAYDAVVKELALTRKMSEALVAHAEKERDELRWHFDRIAKQVMPGEQDTGETVLAMFKERDELKTGCEKHRWRLAGAQIDPTIEAVIHERDDLQAQLDQSCADYQDLGRLCAGDGERIAELEAKVIELEAKLKVVLPCFCKQIT